MRKGVFRSAALISALFVVSIAVFLVYFSIPLFREAGNLRDILLLPWDPDESYGLAPMIAGTVSIALPAAAIAFICSLGISLGMDMLSARKKIFFSGLYSVLSSVPTVVYGFVGIVVLVPMMRQIFGGSGLSIASAVMVLSLLITPSMVLFFRDSFENTPRIYRSIVSSLGGDRAVYHRRVLLPYNTGGLGTGLVIGLGRALGDTMIALMVAGNSTSVPSGPLSGARTLTSHIALLFAGDFDSTEFRSIFASGMILFVLSLLLMVVLYSAGRMRAD